MNETLELLKQITPTKSTKEVIKSFEIYIEENYQNKKEGSHLLPKIQEILEETRKKGQQKASEDVHKKNGNQKEDIPIKNISINDDFIIDNLTGEVIDQRNKSIYEKVKNISQATGECDYINDEAIKNERNKSCKAYLEEYIPTLSEEQIKNLKKVYGNNWQETLQDAYLEGYNAGLKMQLEQAKNEGQNIREVNKKNIEEKKEIIEQPSNIDLDKLKFIYENFEIKTNENNENIVSVKETEQVVLSKKTKNMFLFAKEWLKATGCITKGEEVEISKDLAFSTQNEQIYHFIASQFKKDLNETGNINLEELKTNAEAMGPKYSNAINILFRNEETAKIIDNYFRMQNLNAKAKTETIINASSLEKSSHK